MRTSAAKKTEPEAPATSAKGTGPALLESVAIVFTILDQLAAARRPLGVTELALAIDEPKPRVYRHLASLRQIGIVEQDLVSEKYRLGAKLVSYGTAAGEQFDLRLIADPYLTQLRDQTGQTALLSAVTEDSALVISSVESNNQVCITVKPGNRVPHHCSAQGRIVLAYCDPALQRKILRRGLQTYTDRSIVEPAKILKRLEQIRERLYEEANGEVLEGINVLAAPIFRGSEKGDELVGSIGVIGASKDVPSPPLPDMVAQVQQAAAALTERMNGVSYRYLGLAGAGKN